MAPRRSSRDDAVTPRPLEAVRSGGRVEPASVRDLERQREEAARATPFGSETRTVRAFGFALVCGLIGAAVGALVGLAPVGDFEWWARVGVVALVGFLAGSAYGFVVGGGEAPTR